jgi:hypothetical protein
MFVTNLNHVQQIVQIDIVLVCENFRFRKMEFKVENHLRWHCHFSKCGVNTVNLILISGKLRRIQNPKFGDLFLNMCPII